MDIRLDASVHGVALWTVTQSLTVGYGVAANIAASTSAVGLGLT